MPCVLPVIGLKVMSFVEQSGKSRTHALVLNLWFAAGIVAVFLLLGLLAAFLGLSWGGQFGSTAFNVSIAAVVFAMALSLLGVWEIPIPGFFGSGSVQSAATKEGPLGAFLKGPLYGLRNCLGRHANRRDDAHRVRDSGNRHGKPLRAGRSLPRTAPLPAEARSLDGDL
jgi:thiol:disulfide interchange protein